MFFHYTFKKQVPQTGNTITPRTSRASRTVRTLSPSTMNCHSHNDESKNDRVIESLIRRLVKRLLHGSLLKLAKKYWQYYPIIFTHTLTNFFLNIMHDKNVMSKYCKEQQRFLDSTWMNMSKINCKDVIISATDSSMNIHPLHWERKNVRLRCVCAVKVAELIQFTTNERERHRTASQHC